jgi:hypothetical protein
MTNRAWRAYAPHDHRPLGGYLRSMATLAVGTAGLAGLMKVTGRQLPERPAPADVVLLSIATHKLSRLLTKASVTSPLRAPFTRYVGPASDGELHEQVRDDGGTTRHAIGELATCPFCMAVWAAATLAGGLVLAPRATRWAATVMTAVAASDFLQHAYAAAQRGERQPDH